MAAVIGWRPGSCLAGPSVNTAVISGMKFHENLSGVKVVLFPVDGRTDLTKLL